MNNRSGVDSSLGESKDSVAPAIPKIISRKQHDNKNWLLTVRQPSKDSDDESPLTGYAGLRFGSVRNDTGEQSLFTPDDVDAVATTDVTEGIAAGELIDVLIPILELNAIEEIAVYAFD